jgi:hypothetical protein
MRKAVVVTVILLIGFLFQPLAQMGVVLANPFMFGPHIGIASPQQYKKIIIKQFIKLQVFLYKST